ncbi:MAG: type II toxin-antitoxin system VapC family toxin [Treponema sp.]|jgi:tRNA(fMet)-specific endonuclease VapC|nr:type II toxin-antitoxin system VapC family toxin [Treponema sp.]
MYLLDTNICIYIINEHPKNVVKKVCSLNPLDVKISSVTVAELEYGVSKSKHRKQNRTALYNFLSSFEIIDFDSRDAEIYGIIRADLEQQGKPIGPYDLQLAAQALARNLILVTNNTAEFSKIMKIKLDNWV